VGSLGELHPLFEGVSSVVLNGDTLDTRPHRSGQHAAGARGEVLAYLASVGVPVTLLTGNHDPDISREHSLEMAGGRVLVTHGDVLFDNMVPWSKDAVVIRKRMIEALAALPEDGTCRLDSRLAAFRTVAATIPQRHQQERDPLRYAIRLAGDTVWPPNRLLSMLRAWREAPGRAAALARRHRPKAQFILIGHTHRPGVWRMASGIVVINTGSFCRPFGAMAADLFTDRIRVRQVEYRRGAFRPGGRVAEFHLS
jgi:predicted phosphodiesterase